VPGFGRFCLGSVFGSELVLGCRTGAEPGSTLNPPVFQTWLIGSGPGFNSKSIYILWIGMVSRTEGRRTGFWRVFGLQSRFAFGVGSGPSHGFGSPRTDSEPKSEPPQNRAL